MTLRTFFLCLAAGLIPLCGPATVFGQGNAQADFDLCKNATRGRNADPSILACTRLLNIEIRESAHRRAVMLSFRALGWKAKGDVKRATADLTEAIGLDAGFAPAYEARADIQRESDQCDRARPDYNQAIKLAPDRAGARFGRALCHAEEKKIKEAIADLDEAIKIDPDNGKGVAALAWSMKARLNVTGGNIEAALAAFEAAVKLDPKRADLYLERALVLAGQGNEERALADYDRTIELGDKRYASAAWSGKAALHARKERFDAAIAAYDQAINADPTHAAAYVSRAALRTRKGDRTGALADLDAAIARNPAVPTLYKARGDFHRAQRNYVKALADYDQAIALQPDFIIAYGDRALLRYYMGDFEKSVDDFRHVNEQQPNGYSVLFHYLAATRSGKAVAAEEFSKSISALKPADWPYPIIEVFLGKKNAETLQKEATKPAERCEAHFYLGAFQLTRDLKDQAVKELRAAVANCPEDFVEFRAADEDLKRLN
ncbi:MAG: tetratricopeptide repeat protein [Pseudorhodoplanes sp.]|nr:tetratricopeptide repeat protein [Pseudorhodoplanes sp.]